MNGKQARRLRKLSSGVSAKPTEYGTIARPVYSHTEQRFPGVGEAIYVDKPQRVLGVCHRKAYQMLKQGYKGNS